MLLVGGLLAGALGTLPAGTAGGRPAGCVALPQARLLEVLRWLRPADHPVIAIGTDAEVGEHGPG